MTIDMIYLGCEILLLKHFSFDCFAYIIFRQSKQLKFANLFGNLTSCFSNNKLYWTFYKHLSHCSADYTPLASIAIALFGGKVSERENRTKFQIKLHSRGARMKRRCAPGQNKERAVEKIVRSQIKFAKEIYTQQGLSWSPTATLRWFAGGWNLWKLPTAGNRSMSESMRELIKKRSKIDYRSLLLGISQLSCFPPLREVKTVAIDDASARPNAPRRDLPHQRAAAMCPVGIRRSQGGTATSQITELETVFRNVEFVQTWHFFCKLYSQNLQL